MLRWCAPVQATSDAALAWWTDASAVLDVDTEALSPARAFGLADEALTVVAADKPDRLVDEDKERTTARRLVNQLAKIRGEPPVVDVPALVPSTPAPPGTGATGCCALSPTPVHCCRLSPHVTLLCVMFMCSFGVPSQVGATQQAGRRRHHSRRRRRW